MRKNGKSRVDQLPVAVDLQERACWPTPTVQEAGKIGNQANHGQLALSNHPAIRGEVVRDKYIKGKHGPAVPGNSNTNGNPQESWQTPRQADAAGVDYQYDQGDHMKPRLMLPGQVKQWATPQTRDNRSGGAERWENRQERSRNLNDQIAAATTQNAKLNPRWCETLMGLPVGWVMPSCALPVTIEPTNSDSSATELSPPPPNELFEFCLQS
jgi:hypothetical protein